jgi:hypothetical protein
MHKSPLNYPGVILRAGMLHLVFPFSISCISFKFFFETKDLGFKEKFVQIEKN